MNKPNSKKRVVYEKRIHLNRGIISFEEMNDKVKIFKQEAKSEYSSLTFDILDSDIKLSVVENYYLHFYFSLEVDNPTYDKEVKEYVSFLEKTKNNLDNQIKELSNGKT